MKKTSWKHMIKELYEKARRAVGSYRLQAAACCVLCPLLAVGMIVWHRENIAAENQKKLYRFQQQMAADMTVIRSGEAEARIRQEIEESVAAAWQVPELSDIQKELLDRISEYIETGEYEKAAELMLDNEQQLWYISHYVMKDERYLYDGGKLYRDIDRAGLVLRKPLLVFYGDFADGEPEGECVALQAVQMDVPRYDYASGSWKNGKIDGMGEIGYCCYEGSEQEDRSVKKQGNFRHDRMDGQITYETVSADGETSVWNMTVENGKLLLDGSWSYDEKKHAYQLPEEKNAGHAFVVSADDAGEARFQNLLKWD